MLSKDIIHCTLDVAGSVVLVALLGKNGILISISFISFVLLRAEWSHIPIEADAIVSVVCSISTQG